MYSIVLDIEYLSVERSLIIKALEAEGVIGLTEGYANLHMLPMYQKKIAYGASGFPWSSEICKRQVSYAKGICPVAEELHEKTYIGFLMCIHQLNDEEVDLIVSAFKKVWTNLSALKSNSHQ